MQPIEKQMGRLHIQENSIDQQPIEKQKGGHISKINPNLLNMYTSQRTKRIKKRKREIYISDFGA